MNTIRRSYLYHIAILCLTILLSQTANAAKLPQLLAPGTPSYCLKLTSARPEPRKTLKLATKNVRSPRLAQRNSLGLLTAPFVPVSFAKVCAPGEHRTCIVLQTSRALEIAPHGHSFALRI